MRISQYFLWFHLNPSLDRHRPQLKNCIICEDQVAKKKNSTLFHITFVIYASGSIAKYFAIFDKMLFLKSHEYHWNRND